MKTNKLKSNMAAGPEYPHNDERMRGETETPQQTGSLPSSHDAACCASSYFDLDGFDADIKSFGLNQDGRINPDTLVQIQLFRNIARLADNLENRNMS